MRNFITSTVVIFSAIALSISCNNKKAEQKTNSFVPLRMVEIPAMISNPAERSKYILDHFWSSMNFHDTTYLSNIQNLNVHFSAYLEYLAASNAQIGKVSINKLIDSVLNGDPKIISKFKEMFESAFYDPNSIYKNEELYITVLEKFLVSEKFSDSEKVPMKFQLDLAYRNRLGTKALDFKFILEDGKIKNLYGINYEYTLLMFIEPDCPACKSVMAQMAASSVLSALISRVKVLTIYAGSDFNRWTVIVPNLDKRWINGCDKEMKIMNGSLYDLRPAPSLYLLNMQKTVVLKDAPFNYIEEYLKTI